MLLELQKMRILTLLQRELVGQIVTKLRHFGDGRQQLFIDGLLELLPLDVDVPIGLPLMLAGLGSRWLLLVSLGGFSGSLVAFTLLFGRWLLEEVVVETIIDLQVADIDLGRSGNNVGLINTTKWHAVDLVRA